VRVLVTSQQHDISDDNQRGNCLVAGCDYLPCVSELVTLAGTDSGLLVDGQLTLVFLQTLCLYVILG